MLIRQTIFNGWWSQSQQAKKKEQERKRMMLSKKEKKYKPINETKLREQYFTEEFADKLRDKMKNETIGEEDNFEISKEELQELKRLQPQFQKEMERAF